MNEREPTDRGAPQPVAPAAFSSTPSKASAPVWYPDLLAAVVECVQTGRQRAVLAANHELVTTYWAVGNEIVGRMDAEGWGARVVDRLAADLRERFPDAKGFSPRNLRYMRTFAETWPEGAILQAPLAQLPWYHHIALLERLDAAELRLWYAQAAVDEGWSRNVLVHHIDTQLHRRAGQAITNFARTLPHQTPTWRRKRPATRTSSTSSATPTSAGSVTSNVR